MSDKAPTVVRFLNPAAMPPAFGYTQVVEVTINDYCSTISLVVPPEATVDLGGVETVGGSANNKVRTGPPIGPLHVIVRGKIRFGSVTAKHPFATTFRRMFGH